MKMFRHEYQLTRIKRRSFLMISLSICFTLSILALAQTPPREIVVTSDITCPTCQIVVDKITSIGVDVDSLDLSFLLLSSGLIQRGDGTYYVAPVGQTIGVYEFDSSGHCIRRIGGPGNGPGEYGMVGCITLGLNDSLYVFDWSPWRMSVFSPEGLFIRSVALPLRVEYALTMPNGQILVMGKRSTREYAGLPLHLLTSDGQVLHAFGNINPIFDPRDTWRYRRYISVSNSGTVWSSPEYRYQVEKWSLNGQLIETIIRDASWFPPRDPVIEAPTIPTNRAHRVTEPEPSWFRGAFEDDEGRLWLITVTAGSDWRTYNIEIGPGHPKTAEVDDQLYDTIIEVIDPSSKRLLASRRLPFYTRGIVGKNLIAHPRELISGQIIIEIWKLRLTY
jgi:hypothetical protein